MKSFFLALCVAATAFAQSIEVGLPTAGQTLYRGTNTTVRVDRPDSLTGSTEIGIGITLHHCNQNPCEDATEQLGLILYAGAYSPAFGTGAFGPFENFTVAVPAGLAAGPAVLSVVHTSLVGAGPFALNEIKNVTITLE